MKFTSVQPKIVVVGSSSIDLVLETNHFPKPNECVLAIKSESFFGGKGANQAVGTARLGAQVYFVGCVGMDPFGQQIIRHLIEEGVNAGFVHETESVATGTAYVATSDGTNSIIVVPAANSHLKPKHVEDADKFFQASDLVLVQLEIPMDSINKSFQLAKKYKKPLGIYAAPPHTLTSEIIEYASFIVAKTEDFNLVFPDANKEELLKKYPNKLFVRDLNNTTTYFNGSQIKTIGNPQELTPFKMGMGDGFTSGFAVAFCHKNSTEDCVSFGNEISFKVAQKKGSQNGLPYLAEYLTD